jgi:hypothetical protein
MLSSNFAASRRQSTTIPLVTNSSRAQTSRAVQGIARIPAGGLSCENSDQIRCSIAGGMEVALLRNVEARSGGISAFRKQRDVRRGKQHPGGMISE